MVPSCPPYTQPKTFSSDRLHHATWDIKKNILMDWILSSAVPVYITEAVAKGLFGYL